MMELRQIQYFIEAAKREHVTEAAHALHVAQSAISRQIANLEAELGVQLFIREGRNVKLTSVGRMFLEHAEKVVQEIQIAQQKINEFLDPERGTIRIGFPSSLASHTLPTIISAFRREHPHIRFQLRQGAVRYLIDSLIQGEFDLAFLGPVPTSDKHFTGHILFTERFMALLPIGHSLSDQPFIRLDQLRNDSFVHFPDGFVLRKIVSDACRQMGFRPNVLFESEEIDTIKGLVAAGLGVTILPETTLIENVPRDAVKVNISEPVITRTVGMIVPNNRELAPSEKVFVRFVKEFYAVINQFSQ